MQWIAPSEKDVDTAALEKRLWNAANQLWAGAGLKQSEYSEPVLGLIFLRFAEVRFDAQYAKLEKTSASSRRGSRVDEPAAYHAEGILYLPASARFDYLLNLPEGTDLGNKVNDAMRSIEKDNPHMAGVLPKGYQIFDSRLLAELLKTISTIPATHKQLGLENIEYIGNTVTLQVAPRLSSVSQGRMPEFNVQNVETTVSGQLGDWIQIGGLNQSGQGDSSRISGAGQQMFTEQHSVLIKVEEIR